MGRMLEALRQIDSRQPPARRREPPEPEFEPQPLVAEATVATPQPPAAPTEHRMAGGARFHFRGGTAGGSRVLLRHCAVGGRPVAGGRRAARDRTTGDDGSVGGVRSDAGAARPIRRAGGRSALRGPGRDDPWRTSGRGRRGGAAGRSGRPRRGRRAAALVSAARRTDPRPDHRGRLQRRMPGVRPRRRWRRRCRSGVPGLGRDVLGPGHLPDLPPPARPPLGRRHDDGRRLGDLLRAGSVARRVTTRVPTRGSRRRTFVRSGDRLAGPSVRRHLSRGPSRPDVPPPRRRAIRMFEQAGVGVLGCVLLER